MWSLTHTSAKPSASARRAALGDRIRARGPTELREVDADLHRRERRCRGRTVGSSAVGDLRVDLDARHGPFAGALAPESIAVYAAATNDPNARVVAGEVVPPTFPVILVFDAQ